jgi:hypothetical protein
MDLADFTQLKSLATSSHGSLQEVQYQLSDMDYCRF